MLYLLDTKNQEHRFCLIDINDEDKYDQSFAQNGSWTPAPPTAIDFVQYPADHDYHWAWWRPSVDCCCYLDAKIYKKFPTLSAYNTWLTNFRNEHPEYYI